ncbi:HelD family protein [Fervidicella metallireducens]|uniref:HelD family protein n=1 Tax=Fervidicella metallireducens TaxID=655338 RepID=UPI000AECFF12
MPAKTHPDYNEEIKRLDYTLDYVEKSIISMTRRQKKVEEDLLGSRKSLNSDSSQAYIDLMLNSMFEESIKIKLKKLLDAQSKPYFARIDFKEKDKEQIEKIYIGKVSLMKEENQELVIVDWRAPISNLYYEERLGEASYLCPDGKITGNLSLKRQFSIEKGILNEIFDIDITTNDEFLQTYLGANADNRLKDIVSTIQAEQNRIIRADMWKPLIVQGAAGSGKTTIALHRIAYLIYTYEKTFVPENFMIIAPNRLFLNYISEVLPELGVDKVKQTTFEDFAMELIGKKFKLTDTNEKLTNFVNNNATDLEVEKNKLVEVESKFKSSMMFKEILDEYIKDIEKNFIPKEDFMIGKIVILKYEDINHLFLNEYKDLAMSKRILEIKKHLINRLKYKKESILSYIENECDKRVKFLKTKMEDGEERREKIGKIIDRKYELISKLDNVSKKAVNDYVKKISKIDPYEYYYNLISNKELFYKYTDSKLEDEYQKFIRDYSLEILDSKKVELEDLAPIIYLKYCIHGIDEKIPVKHIVIDEAQDFSLFQIYVIKK